MDYPVNTTRATSSPSDIPHRPHKRHSPSRGEQELQKLDAEYTALDVSESVLIEALSRLRNEERILRLALDQSSETLQERRTRTRKEQEEEALSRLESALMEDLTDSEEEEENEEKEERNDAMSTLRNITDTSHSGNIVRNQQQQQEVASSLQQTSTHSQHMSEHFLTGEKGTGGEFASSSSSDGDIDEDELLRMDEV